MNFFLLGPPAEPHIGGDAHARLDQRHGLELFEQTAALLVFCGEQVAVEFFVALGRRDFRTFDLVSGLYLVLVLGQHLGVSAAEVREET